MEALIALVATFLGGLAFGMMLRDWQTEQRANRVREIELKLQWDRARSHPPPPAPTPGQIPMSDYMGVRNYK